MVTSSLSLSVGGIIVARFNFNCELAIDLKHENNMSVKTASVTYNLLKLTHNEHNISWPNY
jgi:hypothetical protein